MDVLSYLKFWRPSTSTTIKIAKFLDCRETHNMLDEEDDSFFELEFTTSYFDTNSYSYNSDVDDDKDDDDDDDDDDNNINMDNSGVVRGKNTKSAKTATKPSSYSTKVSLSPTLGDLFSRRRVIPLDTNSSPQSPVSSPKMITPRFRVFMFNKSSKSKPGPKQEETDSYFTMKQNVKPVQVQPKPANPNNNKNPLENSLLSESKRFSGEALQKYLKLVKPANVKVSCKEAGGDERVSVRSTPPNTAASPALRRTVKQQPPKRDPLVGIRLAGKRLGKTKLDGSLKAASSPARMDDSLAQQHDGIEGAILHCKRSYNSGRDMTILSRSSSSPLYEKFRV